MPAFFADLPSHWEGISRLHLSWLPENERIQESRSTMSIARKGSFVAIDYTWFHEGVDQVGSLLIAGSIDISAGWTDSWHSSDNVMSLSGRFDNGVVRLAGTYPVDAGLSWGWRIEFSHSDETLVMRMFNISPEDDEEEWAVEATYSPSG